VFYVKKKAERISLACFLPGFLIPRVIIIDHRDGKNNEQAKLVVSRLQLLVWPLFWRAWSGVKSLGDQPALTVIKPRAGSNWAPVVLSFRGRNVEGRRERPAGLQLCKDSSPKETKA
jgi:hypothetical protein